MIPFTSSQALAVLLCVITFALGYWIGTVVGRSRLLHRARRLAVSGTGLPAHKDHPPVVAVIRKRFLPADRAAWSGLFPRNRNDLGGVRAPYCYLAAFTLWPVITTAVVHFTLAGGLILGALWGCWLFTGWRRMPGRINQRHRQT